MPKKTSQARLRVMVICQYWEERSLRGIAEYAREAGWILDIALRHSRRIDLLPKAWRGHGVIANTMGNSDLVAYIRTLRVPVVLSQEAPEIPGAPTLMHDEREVGRVAAKHFQNLGFERFVFVAPAKSLRSLRGDGLEEKVRATGKSFRRIALEKFARELPGLEAPAAILAVNDTCALAVMDILLGAGRGVPRDFALLGVDDDDILCPLGAVPLSSVNLDFEGRGRAAAQLLDRMMRGKSPPAKIVTPIRGVTVRESTNTRAIPHAGAAEALRFLRENFRRPVNLADLAGALGCPVRGIQDVFKRHVGHTLAGELARLRREAALELLKNPKLKLHAVAAACGYSGPAHLSRALRRETGLTPRAWRRNSGVVNPAGRSAP